MSNFTGGFFMKKYVKVLAVIFAFALVACVFAACGEKADGDNVIVFGTNAEFPPFESVASDGVIKSADGTQSFDGIDMVIANKIAEKMGKTAVINNIEFDSLLIALKNGQIDACIAGMTITEERKESVDFSIPYYTATQVMIVKEGSDIKSAKDMAGKKIAVVQGYTGETVVGKLGYEYESFKKGTECVMELVNGKCDVVVIDSATAENYVADNQGLTIVEDSSAFEAEEYGIAVAKGNTELLNQINEAIGDILDDGTISATVVKYVDEAE